MEPFMPVVLNATGFFYLKTGSTSMSYFDRFNKLTANRLSINHYKLEKQLFVHRVIFIDPGADLEELKKSVLNLPSQGSFNVFGETRRRFWEL